MQSGWFAGIALQIRKDGQYYRNLGKPEAVFVEIKGANKTGFSCLFPHFCHKKLIQMGSKKVKKMATALDLTASRRISVCPSAEVYDLEKRKNT